jgi:NAD(P)-dependent dehydrogenase (short-subunit alcohol dehydrogenase family)
VTEFGGVDVLYNNASVARVGPWDDLDYDEWRRSMTYELDIVFLSTAAAWPHRVRRGGGCVINFGSVSAARGSDFVHHHAHGAAKGGVVAFTKHLMVSGIPHNIRAVSISPGLIRTPATAPIFDDPNGLLKELIEKTPSRRVGEPEEVARTREMVNCPDTRCRQRLVDRSFTTYIRILDKRVTDYRGV